MMFTRTAELYDLFYDWKDYAGEAERIRDLIRARNPAATSLLDVACGTGRHLEHLGRWFQAEGVDLDEGLLAVAAGRLPGVPFHVADMRRFDLGRQFDAVTCLFSSIGYVRTLSGLRQAIRAMARHVVPGGLLLVEPWHTPGTFDPNHIGRIITVERPGLAAVRANASRVEGRLSILDMHYLIARPGSIEHRREGHRLGLFSEDEFRSALADARLTVEHDPEGLMGRGLWIARRQVEASSSSR